MGFNFGQLRDKNEQGERVGIRMRSLAKGFSFVWLGLLLVDGFISQWRAGA